MPQVAICHDYLTQRGGAERAVLSISDAFPDAPIYTSLYEPDGTYEAYLDKDVRPSIANAVPQIRSNFRAALPLYPAIFASRRIDADVTICSSSGWAHGAPTTGKKVVYCYAPARWLYQSETYLQGFPGAARSVLPVLRPGLLRWDRRAAASADVYLAISRRSRDMIWDAYGLDAEVLPPPHSIDPTGPQEPMTDHEPGYFLTVSRLMSYKNVEELVEAFRSLPQERLLVVGSGPLEQQLAAECPANVTLLGRVSDAQLRWLYANASALVAVAYEDLGLTPVEAALFGTPALALRFGGYLDTVIDGVNGLHIDDANPASIASAVQRHLRHPLDPELVRRSAERYDRTRFEARLHEIVDEQLRAGLSVADNVTIDLSDASGPDGTLHLLRPHTLSPRTA